MDSPECSTTDRSRRKDRSMLSLHQERCHELMRICTSQNGRQAIVDDESSGVRSSKAQVKSEVKYRDRRKVPLLPKLPAVRQDQEFSGGASHKLSRWAKRTRRNQDRKLRYDHQQRDPGRFATEPPLNFPPTPRANSHRASHLSTSLHHGRTPQPFPRRGRI